MPQVVVAAITLFGNAVVAVGAIGTAMGFGIGVGALAAGAAVVIGGVMVAKRVMSLFEVEMPTVDTDASRQRTVKSTTEPQKIIYGEALVSGPISFIGLSGTDNSDLYQTIVLAGHEVTDITNIHMDDVVITDAQINGGSTAGGNVTGGTFGPKGSPSTTICVINKYRGLASQTADSLLTNAFTNYTSAHRGDGIAYLSMKWVLNDDSAETWDKFSPSNVKALVKGKPVYDPRLDTGAPNYNPLNQLFITYNATSGSYVGQGQNPALVLADYLISDLGMGISPSKIDWSSFITAANGCDVSVNVPNNGTEKRFTCNGVLFATDSHQKNINKILSSMNGNLVYSNGKYIVHAGIYEDETIQEPFETLNEDDLIGAISIKTSLERSDRFNTIKGLFIDPSQNHKSSEFPKVQLADAVTRDNDEILEKEVQYPMTNSSYMAQRLSFKLIKLSDQQKIISFPANLSALRITAGDRVKVSIEELSWSDKIFQCVGWNFSEEGGVNLTLREDSESAYDDPVPNANPALSEYSTVTATGDITDAFRGVPSPSGLTVTPGLKSNELNWVNPGKTNDFGTIYVYASRNANFSSAIKIGETDGTQFIHDGSNKSLIFFPSVVNLGDTYTIRTLGNTDFTAMGAPSGFSVGTVFTATATGSGTGNLWETLSPGDLRYYWVRAVKNIGTDNASRSGLEPPNDPNTTVFATVGAVEVDWVNVADPAIGIDINNDTISINTGVANTTTGQAVAQSGIEAGTTVTQGGITMNQGGSIKGGQSAYNSGTGFFLGYDTNAYKFSIGNSNTEALTFDGTNLAVTGAITATSGSIGNSVTVGGTAASTVASDAAAGNQAADQISLLPRADDSEWTVGTGGKGIWNVNGDTSENAVVVENGPHGELERIWKATSTDASGADGGFENTSIANRFPIVSDTTYRFSVFIKQDNTNGTIYLGAYNFNGGSTLSLYRYDGTGADANKYWFANDLPTQGEWYLLVGFINPSNTNSNSGKGGIYNLATGVKVTAFDDFRFSGDGSETDATTFSVRTYNYYAAATPTSIVRWAHPRVDRLDRRAPSIAELLRGWTSLAEPINAGVTITGGGITMSGGGSIKGGQSAYNNGTGFFLGYDTNAYKFSIGNAGNNSLAFDGTNLAVTGAITATSGTFTGTVNASAGEFTGSVSIGSTGAIYGGTMDEFLKANTSGFFLGYDTDAYKLSVGNSSGEVLTWDGSKLNVEANTVSFSTGGEQDYSSESRYTTSQKSATVVLANDSSYFLFDNRRQDLAFPDFIVSYYLGPLTSGTQSSQANARNGIMDSIQVELFYADASTGSPSTWTSFRSITADNWYTDTGTNYVFSNFRVKDSGSYVASLDTRNGILDDYPTMSPFGDAVDGTSVPVGLVDNDYFINIPISRNTVVFPKGRYFIKVVITVTDGPLSPYPSTGSPTATERRVSIPNASSFVHPDFGQAVFVGGAHTTIFTDNNRDNETLIKGGSVYLMSKEGANADDSDSTAIFFGGRGTTGGTPNSAYGPLHGLYFFNDRDSIGSGSGILGSIGSPQFSMYVPYDGSKLTFGGDANFTDGLYINGVAVNAGAVTGPAGADTQIQYNNGGSLGASANLTFNDSTNTLTVSNLTVSGTTTTVNTDNLTVKDPNITLNYATGDSSSTANNAGITIQDAVDASTDASLLWKTATDRFEFSHAIYAPAATFTGNVETKIIDQYQEFSAGNGDHEVHYFSKVLATYSENYSAQTYIILTTTVPQSSFAMGGFQLTFWDSYSTSTSGDVIDIYGYFSPESNGGFTGFRYNSKNPNFEPTIQVGANSSGNTVFILSNFGTSSYAQLVAKDFWSGYTSTGAARSWGQGWSFSTSNSISAYSNLDTLDRNGVTSAQITNLSTAYNYSQVGHLPLAGGTLTGAVSWPSGSSTNANTAYTYSQVGHLPLTGGTLTGGLSGTTGSFSSHVSVVGDLKFTGTDSLIWTPNTTSGYSGFYDPNNNRIAAKYQNDTGGWGLLGDPVSGYALKVHGSISSGSIESGAITSISAIGAADDVRTGLIHYDSTAMAAGVGGQLILGYKYLSTGAYTAGAILKTYKENATSNHYGSGLKFQVRNTGFGLSTKMTLNPSGNLSVTGGIQSSGPKNQTEYPDGILSITDTTAVAAGVGGGLLFQGKFSGSTITTSGSIDTRKDNATAGSFGFSMVFNTRVNGGANTTALTLGSNQSATFAGTVTATQDAYVDNHLHIGKSGGWLQFYDDQGVGNTVSKGNLYFDATTKEFRFYSAVLSTGAAETTSRLKRYTGSAYATVYDTEVGVPWADISAGVRTNFTIGFKPATSNYAGLLFQDENANGAGYLLVRANSDVAPTYKANGVHLIADAGYLSLVSRTTSNTGVRILSGAVPAERMVFKSDGEIDQPNAIWKRTYHQEHAYASGHTANTVHTHWGVLAAGSHSGAPSTYTIIQTNVSQDAYRMGGFTLLVMDSYGDYTQRERIDLAGYWNPESNGGFQGWGYTTTNPSERPTIQVMRNSSTGKVAFAYSHTSGGSVGSYPVIVACDLWLGFSSAIQDDGRDWSMIGAGNLTGYTNIDTVNYAGGNGNYQKTDGQFVISKSNGAMLSHGSFSDAIGYNASYGTYVGAGGRYVYSGSTSTGNGGSHPYYSDATGVYNILHNGGQIANTYNGDHTFTTTTTSAGIKVTNNQSGGPALKIHNTATDGTDWWLISNGSSNTDGAGKLQLWSNNNSFTTATFGETATDITRLNTQTRVTATGAPPNFTTTTSGETTPVLLANVNGQGAHGLVVNQTQTSHWAQMISTQGYGLYIDNHASSTSNDLFKAAVGGVNQFYIRGDGTVFSKQAVYIGDSSVFGTLQLRANSSEGGTIDAYAPNGSYVHSDVRDNGTWSMAHKFTYKPGNGYGQYAESWWDGSSYHQLASIDNAIRTNGDFVASGNITAYGSFSDIRLKENIVPFLSAREAIAGINTYKFNYKGKADTLIGVIAQEVEKTLPELTYELIDDDKEVRKAVRYDHLSAVLLQAVKEQDEEIKDLKEMVKQLMEKIQ